MNEADAIEIAHSAIWTIIVGAGPAVAAAMIVGIVISLIQALTQVQEVTLTFIPKVFAVIVVFFLSLGYMTRIALDLFNNTVLPIISR